MQTTCITILHDSSLVPLVARGDLFPDGPMTIQPSQKSAQKKSLLQQLGNLLTGDRPPASPVPDTRTQPSTLAANVVLPFSAPPIFIVYAAEGDEPADLALIELIPTGLKAFNLPYVPVTEEALPAAPSATNNICPLTDRPSSAEAMSQATVAADLSELTPIELTSLNIAHQNPIPPALAKNQATITEKPQERALEQNNAYQSADHKVTSQTQTPSNFTPEAEPLPDLSKLKKTSLNSSNHKYGKSNLKTVRVPVNYFNQLEDIVAGLLKQQTQQTRHNEQLGALIKQLLSRVAQQQTELNRLEKGDYSNVQQIIQTCLTPQ